MPYVNVALGSVTNFKIYYYFVVVVLFIKFAVYVYIFLPWQLTQRSYLHPVFGATLRTSLCVGATISMLKLKSTVLNL
jgi:hypothetical protein